MPQSPPQTLPANFNQWDQTASPPASLPADFNQWDQPSALDRFAAKLPGSSNDTGLRGAVHHLGDTYNAVIKPLVDIGPYGIAHAMYEKAQGQPAEIQALPRKMMEQGTMMLAGGVDAPEAEAGGTAQPMPATVPADASEGMLGRALKVLTRKASGYIPGMHTAKEIAAIPKDLDYVLNGPATTAEQVTAAKAVPEIWGKGKYGTPVAQWGQRIPSTDEVPPQNADPLDRLRNQEYPPAQPSYPAERPSIERIMPQKSEGEAGSMVQSVTSERPPSAFPPPKSKGKFQYDPSRIPPKYQPPPTFDTTGITRDVDEDNAIEDAMRNDLARHGTIARMQANREFAAGNSMDTPKGVLQEQARNTFAAPGLVDAGAPNLGSPVEPLEFLNGAKGFKQGGQWLLKSGDQWKTVSNTEMKQAVTAGSASSASSEQESQDLLDKLSQMNDIVQALKAKKGR